jgi:hypothetical protein
MLPDRKDLKVHLVRLDLPHKDHKDRKAQPALPVQPDHKVLQVL